MDKDSYQPINLLENRKFSFRTTNTADYEDTFADRFKPISFGGESKILGMDGDGSLAVWSTCLTCANPIISIVMCHMGFLSFLVVGVNNY